MLSSYNGERYITEQLNSLSSQTQANWTIRLRDDGSSDRTWPIIEAWQAKFADRMFSEKALNVGVIPSFFELIGQADEESDYFCFCDQDDVWLPEKMERAIDRLSEVEKDVPAMVFTSTQLVDADLNPLGIWPEKPLKAPSFYNALVQNIAVGATVTFNRSALQLVRSHMPDTNRVLMHDWWFYLCVSAFGEVLYDPEPSILYRQHGNNAVGGETSKLGKLKKKWASFRKHRGSHKLVEQAREFHRLYASELHDKDKLQQLEWFIAPRDRFRQRLNYLRRSKLYRQSRIENLLFRFLILIKYI
nr:glycosyltransferase family 2 protein [Saccharibacillus endophyticus]